jgi:hypothetical protein
MATGALASVNEYLSSSYDPDCEYIDGVVLERNGGERDHSTFEGATFAWFFNRRKDLRIAVFPEQRVQVTPTRFRVDPKTRLAYRWTREGMHQVHELRTENPAIVVPLADLFEA